MRNIRLQFVPIIIYVLRSATVATVAPQWQFFASQSQYSTCL